MHTSLRIEDILGIACLHLDMSYGMCVYKIHKRVRFSIVDVLVILNVWTAYPVSAMFPHHIFWAIFLQNWNLLS
jgi:hypothetical protein